MRGHIRQRGKASWSIVLDLGRDATGKRIQKWHSVKGTKKDAERELPKLLNSVHNGTYVEPVRMTVAEYLDRWLKDYAHTNVAAKTYDRYEQIVRVHLKPDLGNYNLSKLQPLHIQSSYSKALESGRKDGKEGGLSAQTVLHHHRILREALQQAVRWQLLARNPADAVEPPRPSRKEMSVIDETQTAQLLEEISGTWIFVPCMLAIATGMRRGEILAVRWQDLDLEAGVIRARRSLQQAKGGLSFKDTKGKKGRAIKLPAFAVDLLRRHRVEQAKQRLQFGPAYDDEDLVCARLHGTPISPNELTAAFAAVIRESDLPRVRFHDLRHSHATQLLRQGIHPKVVSERLGHSNIAITLDVYSHVLPDMQDEAARRIDSALRTAIDSRK
jgi:integrase